MKTTALGDLTTKIKTWDPRRRPDVEFKYIDLGAVDNETKEIGPAAFIKGFDAPSRARQLVSSGDIIVSTVRPNLNAVAVVPEFLDGATVSTGFTVLRPTRELDGRYLYHWVRSPQFVSEMVSKATGASYPAVSDRIVKESLIPNPPLAIQRRIAGILDQADAIRAKRRQVLAHLDALAQSVFHDMFGGDSPSVTVEQVAKQIRTGPFGSQLLHSEFVDEGVAVLGLDNVVSNEFQWAQRRYVTPEKYEKLRRYTVAPGDVLISIMGTTGRCVVVPDGIPTSINTKHICAITVDKARLEPPFLRACFLWHPMSRSHLHRQTKGSIMDGLNMGIIKEMPMPIPPLNKQREFAARVERVDARRALVQRALDADNELFASLQARAFRGEL